MWRKTKISRKISTVSKKKGSVWCWHSRSVLTLNQTWQQEQDQDYSCRQCKDERTLLKYRYLATVKMDNSIRLLSPPPPPLPSSSSSSAAAAALSPSLLLSSTNDNGDVSENGKTRLGLDWPNNNSARALRFFVHSFAVTARLRRENA